VPQGLSVPARAGQPVGQDRIGLAHARVGRPAQPGDRGFGVGLGHADVVRGDAVARLGRRPGTAGPRVAAAPVDTTGDADIAPAQAPHGTPGFSRRRFIGLAGGALVASTGATGVGLVFAPAVN